MNYDSLNAVEDLLLLVLILIKRCKNFGIYK